MGHQSLEMRPKLPKWDPEPDATGLMNGGLKGLEGLRVPASCGRGNLTLPKSKHFLEHKVDMLRDSLVLVGKALAITSVKI